ncbi:MAG: hypothetical protein ACMXYG_00685 [Candidatus Woesearchaeota archaeon]
MKSNEPFNRPRKCPRCKKMHCTDDYSCEHCFFSLLNDRYLEPGRYFIGEL